MKDHGHTGLIVLPILSMLIVGILLFHDNQLTAQDKRIDALETQVAK